MLKFHDCVPCLVKQALDASRMATSDEEVHERTLRKVLQAFAETSLEQFPARLSYMTHTIVKKETGCPDPYFQMKQYFNQVAGGLYPRLKEEIARMENRFEAAIKLAIAGNIIDFSIRDADTVYRTIEDTLNKPFAIDHLQEFREALTRSRKILYIGDNAGETFFDRILIEELPREKVTYVVKGGPIINDATMEDARVAGIHELVRVISIGSSTPGTMLEMCSEEFREEFLSSDLIISKGQANYETLQNSPVDVVFLLRVKCPTIARDTGKPIGSIILQFKPKSGR